jgi:hypothetical protein
LEASCQIAVVVRATKRTARDQLRTPAF